jgi:hypothetical protein
MVVRWKNKDGTGGVLTRPYTPEERAWLRDFSTWDHGTPTSGLAREARRLQKLPPIVEPTSKA